MTLDKDLQSIQEARDLARAAKEAQFEYQHYSQEQVDKIIKAMADAGYNSAEHLAKLAYEETGFGKWQDKVIKNQFGTKNVYESIKDLKTVGIVGNEANGKVIRIHRSSIINVSSIKQMELYEKDSYRVIMKDETKLPVSKTGLQKLRGIL